jgi:hypothetical protein
MESDGLRRQKLNIQRAPVGQTHTTTTAEPIVEAAAPAPQSTLEIGPTAEVKPATTVVDDTAKVPERTEKSPQEKQPEPAAVAPS